MSNSWISNLADTFINTATSALGAGFKALRDPGGFLRDELPPEADGVTKWIQDRNRRACRQHARNEAAGLYSDLGALRRPRYGHCKPYLDSINEGPISGGSYGPPFTGGQCAQRYAIQASAVMNITSLKPGDDPNYYPRTANLNVTCTGFSTAIGPVGAIELVPLGDPFDTKKVRIRVTPNSSFPNGEIVFFQDVDNGRGLYIQSRSQTVTPCSGNPDNCGNPPNEYQPPRYPTGLPPLPPPTIAPPGGDGSDDIQVDPDGNWRICENGDCTPWFPPGGGGGPDSGGGPGEPDGDPQENDPNDPNDPQEITGCVEDGNLLTGLKIEIIETPNNSSGSNGVHYRVAWIYMGPDSDKLDLVSDGKTLEDGQFVIPDSRDCTCYKVRMNLGWGLRVQAFSRPKED